MIQNTSLKIQVLLFVLSLLSWNGFAQKNISKIAFGSCANQSDRLPIFDIVVKHKPDLFVFLGDNIYGDTNNMITLQSKYDRMAAKPTFQNLKKNVPLIATWDDHDYGQNDAGRHYPKKEASKEIFLKFFNESENSDRRKHEGVYTSYMYENKGKKVQIILLDNRTFRDNYKKYNGEVASDKRYFYSLDYAPQQNPDSTYLGAAQWKWLEEELKKPADLRLIGSGSQFGIEYNGYEGWANFPLEQKRFLALIKKTKANGVLFLSGDVHYAEISKLTEPGLYPIYDFTSSGLSSNWHFATPNKNRIEGPIMENHFGLLTIDWKKKIPEIKMEIWDINDNQRAEHTIGLDEIRFKK
ncbi:alkaline phosphatase D family protein [Flavobacterium sp. LB3P45]|uniref:Alkaline phosphatase D family protein n=1 Tax=Flavobacterium fructosi TaxID=3230416 RepID=A0ABW6HKQ0_9FLAO